MKHTLKTDSEVFQAVYRGKKKHEIRFNDRDYRAGDELVLKETMHTGSEIKAGEPLIYTGATILARVTHVLHGPIYGLMDGWVILSIDVFFTHKPPAILTNAATKTA
jgi:ASC-1-like (ASCH) protein